MAGPAEDFLQQFQSLEGTTIAQRKKSLFQLLHHNSSLKGNPELLDTITARLVPKTYLESLFRVEFLIYYRRVGELYQLLKEGNDVFVSKIIKQVWFFKEGFDGIGAEQLVNEVLPSLSFCVRMKVLKKLCQFVDPTQFDKIFDAVVTRYGIFIAKTFIVGCTPMKIRQVLSDNHIDLTTLQLKVLYKKDPTLIKFYLKLPNTSIYRKTKFLQFLYKEDESLYCELQKEFNFSLTHGRRLTKRVLKVRRDEVLENPSNFKYLCLKTVVRKIGKNYLTTLFCKLLPSVPETFEIKNSLTYFPKKYHYTLYMEAIRNHYNLKFEEHPELINGFLLKLIEDNSERDAIAKILVDDGQEDYIKYLSTQNSIPILQEKMNVTSDIYERGRLVHYLIKTCHINKDLEALIRVMKYFCARHKNDELNVHMEFIDSIENLFGFEKFTEEMWNLLNGLLTIHMLKFDNTFTTYQKIQTLPLIKFNRGTSTHQKLSYLHFLFNKNEPIDDLLLEYMNSEKKFPEWGKYSKAFEKYFLLFVIDKRSQEPFEEDHIRDTCSVISELESWNDHYKDDQLSFYDFPMLLKSFDHAIRNFDHVDSKLRDIFRCKIFTTSENKYKDKYTQIYWNRLHVFKNCDDFVWFLQYEPRTLVKYLDKFMDGSISENEQFKLWNILKKFTHLHFDEKLIQICINKLKDEACLENKVTFVPCLSVLMKVEDYIALADFYKPASKKLELDNEREVKLYNLQCAIGKHFKNTKHHKALPSLLNYCAGDYFKYSMPSLYSILYRTPENILPHYLDCLAKKAVSVRKHALYLTCELSAATQVENVLNLLSKTEEVESLQKYMFTSTIKYFVKNPSNKFFDFVKLTMQRIKEEDEESHELIVQQIGKMPVEYKASYIQYCWEYFEKIIRVWKKLKLLKQKLVREMMEEEICKLLPIEFVVGILKKHFMVNENLDLGFKKMSSWAFLYFCCREEKAVILEIILNFIDQKDRKDALNFFRDWYMKIMEQDGDTLEHIEPFITYFDKKIDIVKEFYDHVKIFFLRIKLEFPGDTAVNNLYERIFTFFENLVSTYGPFIVKFFANEFKKAICNFADELALCNYLLDNHPSTSVAMLVLYLLEPKPEGEYLGIREKIAAIPDSVVQIALNC